MITPPPHRPPPHLCPQAAPDSDGSTEVLLPLGIVPRLDPSPLPSPPPQPRRAADSPREQRCVRSRGSQHGGNRDVTREGCENRAEGSDGGF